MAIVPPNTRGTVHLPGARVEQVLESGAGLATAPGVRRTTQTGDTAVAEVRSGNYVFTYDAPALAATLRAPIKR